MNAEGWEELRELSAKLLSAVCAAQRVAVEPAPKLLTFEQAAEALAVSRTTVQELVDRGELPVVSVTGRAVRVDARDVEAFVKRKRERRGQ